MTLAEIGGDTTNLKLDFSNMELLTQKHRFLCTIKQVLTERKEYPVEEQVLKDAEFHRIFSFWSKELKNRY